MGFTEVTVPPALTAPWKAIAYSGTLGAMIATTSPVPMPSPRKPWAASVTAPKSPE